MGLFRFGVGIQFQTSGSGVIRRSPVILHECVTKRYFEFNFSSEQTFEGGGKAVNRRVLVCALCNGG